MEQEFVVGDVVEQRDSGRRMKVESIDDEGRFVCAWKRGAAQHRRKFTAAELLRSMPSMRIS
ncbi:MAG TPA: hypothetical protein VLI06_20125 [Solimonas sp.]|nr:hypothetical protein [Solimonas sp.]